MAEIPVPPEVEELIEAYRGKEKLTDEQWTTLRDFLATVPNVAEFLKENYGYTDRDYGRLREFFSSHGWTLGAKEAIGRPPKKGKMKKKTKEEKVEPPEKQIKKTVVQREKEELVKLASQVYGDAIRIGKLVQAYGARASELGYYNKDEDKPDLDRFVKDALDFFIETGPRVMEIEQENRANKALLEILGPAWNRTLIKMRDIRMALNIVLRANPELELKLLPLRAEVPEFEED